jgi:folate-dependent phosphoribosylglycinamide formyltransferase PurN
MVLAVLEIVDFVEAAAQDAGGVRDGDGADVADEEVHALEHQAAPRVLRVVAALAALRARVLGALPGVGASLAGA